MLEECGREKMWEGCGREGVRKKMGECALDCKSVSSW